MKNLRIFHFVRPSVFAKQKRREALSAEYALLVAHSTKGPKT